MRFRHLVFLSALTFLASCGGTALTEHLPGDGSHTYTLKGRILEMPLTEGSEIQIEHEAIHDLIDSSGEVVGMDAMMMIFSLDVERATPGLAVGDIVEFDLEVDWNADPMATVTRLEKLPADTELVFGAAEPTG